METEGASKGIIAWFIRNPVAANLLMAFIIGAGYMMAGDLRREGIPAFPLDRVTVSVFFPSGSPKLTEESVVLRIESALRGAEGVKQVTSTASSQGASIVVEMKSGYDLDELLTEIKSRVDSVPNFPRRAERPVIEKQRYDEHVISLQLYGDVSLDVLEPLARQLQTNIYRLPGVQRADLIGSRSSEVHVELDETALQKYGIDLSQVSAIIDAESVTELGGQLRSADGTLSLKADQQAYWRQDFEQIPVITTDAGVRVRLGDIARIEDGYADSSHVWCRFQGMPSIGLRVYKDPNGNSDSTSQEVKAFVESWTSQARLPKGVSLATWNDRSEQVSGRIRLLSKNALLGAAFVFTILALTIDPRFAFWVAMGLPVAFGGAVLAMGSFFEISLNDLTTFGMIVAFGIVVDDAVVIGESVYDAKRRNRDRSGSTLLGVHRVALPTVFGVLTTIAAFSMLPLVEGRMGKVFSQFAMVVSAALFFSIIESKLILPAHLSPLRTEVPPRSFISQKWAVLREAVDRLFDLAARSHGKMLCWILQWRYGALLVIFGAAIFVVGLIQRGHVRSVFFPDFAENVILGSVEMDESSGYGLTERNIEQMNSALTKATFNLAGDNGFASVVRAVHLEQTSDLAGKVQVELQPVSERSVSADTLVDEWRRATGPLEGATSLVFTSDDLDDDAAFELRLDSAEPADLVAAVTALQAALRKVPGLLDIRNNLSFGRSEIQLSLTDLGRASGLTLGLLAEQVQQSFLGYETQRFQRGVDEVRLRVRYPEQLRSEFSDLETAWVRTPDGSQLPLTAVADVERTLTLSTIHRIDGNRVASITAGMEKSITSIGEIRRVLNEDILPAIKRQFPGVSIKQAGEAEEEEETMASLLKVLLLAISLIYVLIAIPLKSYTQPLLIMAIIPFGVLGAVIGHWIHGLPISLLSMFGMLALAGIVVNDSLLLMSTYNRLRLERVDAVRFASSQFPDLIDASCRRFRAIILTSITTFVGLVPLVFETSEQAQYLIPAAIALSYGVLFATILTLVLIPILLAVSSDIGCRLSSISFKSGLSSPRD